MPKDYCNCVLHDKLFCTNQREIFHSQPSSEEDSSQVTALREQLKTLTAALTTLNQEKSRVESQFVADNKQLRVNLSLSLSSLSLFLPLLPLSLFSLFLSLSPLSFSLPSLYLLSLSLSFSLSLFPSLSLSACLCLSVALSSASVPASFSALSLFLCLCLCLSLSLLSSLLFPQHYHLFHHYCSSQCCYYCFMCSLLVCTM